jgi:hypothetical protein
MLPGPPARGKRLLSLSSQQLTTEINPKSGKTHDGLKTLKNGVKASFLPGFFACARPDSCLSVATTCGFFTTDRVATAAVIYSSQTT